MKSLKSIFYGAQVLNRVSFLRSDAKFIDMALKNAKFCFFKNHEPLCMFSDQHKVSRKLVSLDYSQLNGTLQKVIGNWSRCNESKSKELLQLPQLVFMGLDEKKRTFSNNKHVGQPYFAFDIGDFPESNSGFKETLTDNGIELKDVANFEDKSFVSLFDHLSWLGNRDASLMSQGKMYLEWLSKNLKCPDCGSDNIAIDAGTQLLCTSSGNTCKVKGNKRINSVFPRTDLAVISTVINVDQTKILLVNNKNFGPNLYTCVAGFLEPSETIEQCVAREVWEETQVRCHEVRMLLSQPWPYPGTLMMGCCGVSDVDGEKIGFDNDDELRDAKWFDISLIAKVLEQTENLDNALKDAMAVGETERAEKLRSERWESDIQLPMGNTVAFELIKRVVQS